MPGRDYGMLLGIRRIERRDELVPRDSGKPEVANTLTDVRSGKGRNANWTDGQHLGKTVVTVVSHLFSRLLLKKLRAAPEGERSEGGGPQCPGCLRSAIRHPCDCGLLISAL